MCILYETDLTNCSIEHFINWHKDMVINGWEIVIFDGKFYMQRKIDPQVVHNLFINCLQ